MSEPATTPDQRLAQKVTYEAEFQTVEKILEDLSNMTGIKLRAGHSSSDWQVHSRKMNIFVRDVEFLGLMNSIASTMRFRWGRSGNHNPPVYCVVVDPKAVSEANAKKARAEKLAEELWWGRRGQWLEIIMRDGSMSSAEIDALRETDPVFYRHAKPGALRALRALFLEIPEAKDAFANGWSFRISADRLSAETRRLLLTTADEFAKFMQRGYGHEPRGNDDIFRPGNNIDIAYSRLDVGSFTPNLRWTVYTQGSTGYFHVSIGARDLQIVSLGDKDSAWTRALCERENKIMDGLGDFGSTRSQLFSNVPQLETDREKEDELLHPSEPLIEHIEFPAIANMVKLEIEKADAAKDPLLALNKHVAKIQKAIAEATGIGVVSDSWANIAGKEMPSQEARLGELLEKFSSQYNYNWDRSPSGILEFRHRKWWKNRLNQIPEHWIAAWRENTVKNSILSLDDLAQISNLTYEQAEESLKSDKVLGASGLYSQTLRILDTNGNLDCLRLYSMLSPRQRAILASEVGLNGTMLSDKQWERARVIFDRIGTSRGEAIFHMGLVPNDKETIYRFREFDDGSGEEDRSWLITLPRYVAPADPGL